MNLTAGRWHRLLISNHYFVRPRTMTCDLDFLGLGLINCMVSFILCMFQYYHLIIYLSSHQIDE